METNDDAARGTVTEMSLTLGKVSGDLLIRRWGSMTSEAIAQLVIAGTAPISITLGMPAPEHIDGDATLYVGDGVLVTIATITGDVTIASIGAALTIEKVHGDVRIDGAGAAVVIGRVNGDVTARNLTADLTIAAVKGDLSVDHVSGVAHITTVSGDATLRAVSGVVIDNVGGDLRVQDVGTLTISGQVEGDAVLAKLSSATIDTVDGDLTALEISEGLALRVISGDARVRHLRCPVNLVAVAGDLAAQDVVGGITASVSGEAYLETSLGANMSYDVTATEIVLRVRGPINAQFVAQATNGEIRTHLPLAIERHRNNLVGVIGRGEATVTLISTDGDILLDAAGADEATESEQPRDWSQSFGKSGFRVHIGHGPHGPNIAFHGPFTKTGVDSANFGWPFGGDFTMSTPEDFEQRIRDIGERTGRAARKAAEKAREYSDRASSRARDTDWESVSREVRTAIEKTVAELEVAFREIVSEFNAPATNGGPSTGNVNGGTTPAARTSGATAQRVPIDIDPTNDAASTVDRDAQRRSILEQLRSGDLTLEDANEKLRHL